MRLYFAFIAIISASLPHAGAEDVSSALAANPANSPAVPAQSAEQSKADGSNAAKAEVVHLVLGLQDQLAVIGLAAVRHAGPGRCGPGGGSRAVALSGAKRGGFP